MRILIRWRLRLWRYIFRVDEPLETQSRLIVQVVIIGFLLAWSALLYLGFSIIAKELYTRYSSVPSQGNRKVRYPVA